MRVLLDECVSEELRNYLAGHECQTARYAGFAGLENGQLLSAAEAATPCKGVSNLGGLTEWDNGEPGNESEVTKIEYGNGIWRDRAKH